MKGRRKSARNKTHYSPRIQNLESRKLFANGDAFVQILNPPGSLESDEPVDISVRYMLTDNSKRGPWKVNSLALFDKDFGPDDKIVGTSSLQVEEQDVWHYHTFHDVDLTGYIDGSNDAVELYAEVKIDDKRLNGVDAKDESPVYNVQAYADLEVSGITLSDDTVTPGQKIWVHFDVENNGLVKSKSGYTGVMLSTNSYISTSDQLLAREWHWRVDAGASNTESRRITIPHDAPIGSTFYIGTIADYNENTLEGFWEANNNLAAARRITIVDPRADLVVDTISLEHVKSDTIVDVASPGQRIKAHAVIGNDGNSRAWTFNVDFYWSSKPWGLDTKLADNWVFAINAGNHNTERARFTVPDVPSGTYYVTARADSESEVNESDETNNLHTVAIDVYNPLDYVADFAPGVTVITAGFQPLGSENGTPQDYTIEMAEAILERAYGADTQRGSVFISDPHSGLWVNPNVRYAGNDDGFGNWRENSNDPNDEIVLIYDWSWESDKLNKGWSEAAGDNLFASLADPLPMGDDTVHLLDRPLHFIGASRGTVVNTHAVQRIDHHFPDVTVDHFTTLDPHPARGPLNSIDDYGSSIKKLILPDNVAYADNFYRQDPLYEIDLDFNGVEVPGAVNLELNERALALAGSPIEHSDVPTWYLATIATQADEVNGQKVTRWGFRDWWISGKGFDETIEPLSGRALVGYANSRVGGRARPMHLMDHTQFTYDTAPASVFNGNFEYGLTGVNHIAGWERHGGGGDGNLNGVGNNYLKLNLNDSLRRSNRIYVSPEVTAVKFDWQVQNADDDNLLRVSLDGEILTDISLAQEHSDFQRNLIVPLTFTHNGFVDMLGFEIVNPDNDTGQSGVRIDNVEFISGSPTVGFGATAVAQSDTQSEDSFWWAFTPGPTSTMPTWFGQNANLETASQLPASSSKSMAATKLTQWEQRDAGDGSWSDSKVSQDSDQRMVAERNDRIRDDVFAELMIDWEPAIRA